MARHIWDLDDPRYKFALARAKRRKAAQERDAGSSEETKPGPSGGAGSGRPEGIVEANRRARRENRALREPE